MKTAIINDGWQLADTPLSGKDVHAVDYANAMACALPCDVHMPLIQCGRIKDPVLADYSFDSEWIEKRAWWFRKELSLDVLPKVMLLRFDSIDAHGDVYVNGIHIGRHESAFYPFERDIRPYVREGLNTIDVRVTTGLESVSDDDLAEIDFVVCTEEQNGCPERGDKRRALVRRPAYSTGWDWGPKCATCGIVGDAQLICADDVLIRSVNAYTTQIQETYADLHVALESELLDYAATADGSVTITLSRDGQTVVEHTIDDVLLTSGINYTDATLRVDNPALWWPNGYGEQPLYTLHCAVTCKGETASDTRQMGIRTITLDTQRTDGDHRTFAFVVNGVHIFCKGGNYIPADSVYARVTVEKHDKLVAEAKAANFNMLRIWGGGIYQPDAFYDACDRYGILIWHDFMFGCTAHPDHLAWFNALVEKEMAYQTKRLRTRACMALWCGNNENHQIFGTSPERWGIRITRDKQYGLYTGNALAVDAVRAHCPHIPYWNSSPYGGADPNAENVGDKHNWGECMMNPDMSRRIDPFAYDACNSRFVSEYGYPGPCVRESIEQYFDGQPIDSSSRVWKLHTNTFEKHTVAAGMRKHHGVEADALSLDEYILYAGAVQSLMLEYSLSAHRFKDFCGGALFWMYNDCWGEVGWTIIDYYLRRKASFYGVKRAFAPIKLIMRECDGRVQVMGCNDTAQDVSFDAEIGYLPFDGNAHDTQIIHIDIPARTRRYVYECALPDQDYTSGVLAITPKCDIERAILLTHDTPIAQVAEFRVH